jgi:putative ABC transport system permease protein
MSTNFMLALKSLRQNRLQAALTLLGMSIGIAMVLLVSGLGLGAQQQIETQIESAGPTLITVRPGNFTPLSLVTAGQQDSSGGELAEGSYGGEGGFGDISFEQNAAMLAARERATKPRKSKIRSPAWPLRTEEMQLLSERIANVRMAAASLSGNINLVNSPSQLIRTTRVYGYAANWPEMESWKLLGGRLINSREHDNGDAVMLVSPQVAQRFWPMQEAIGQWLQLGDENFEIIGLVDTGDEEANALIPSVYVSSRAAMRLLGRDDFDEINVRSVSVGKTTEVAESIRAALRELRELPEDTIDDFRVDTQSLSAMPGGGTDPRLARAVHANMVEFEQASWEEMATSLRQAGRTFTYLLSGAAAVSLLVGGIGVMNIMLVSVTARTREIGLRMAMGARVRDVMLQFMVESITLAALGGLIGLGLGAATLFFARTVLNWTTAISPVMLFIAIAMAALTGLVFGYGPARRAAELDPVVALKAE